MPVLRFSAGLLILAAAITLVRDASPWLAGIGPFQAKSLMQHWTELSPRTLTALRSSVGGSVWQLVIAPLLGLPTVLTAVVLAVAIGWLGRRRRKINVYAN
jgi:hypothetical protein